MISRNVDVGYGNCPAEHFLSGPAA